MHKSIRLFLLFVCACAAVAHAGTKAKSSPAAKPIFSICGLISQPDAEAALGGGVGQPIPISPSGAIKGGCNYMASNGGFIGIMIFEPDNPATFYSTTVRESAKASHLKVEDLTGIGEKAAFMTGNFYVLKGKQVVNINYSMAPREKIELLVRKMAPQL